LRWLDGKWNGDGGLTKESAAFLRQWLAERGVPGPQQEFAESQERKKKSAESKEKWLQAMPPCLKPYWDSTQGAPSRLPPPRELLQALAQDYPDQEERIRALLGWYGSGAENWSDIRGYEVVAEDLLLSFETKDILKAIQHQQLSEPQIEGAARLFAVGYRQRCQDMQFLPAELKARLLEHSLKSAYKGNRERAQKAFGTP
jgi:hypothetical protein